MPFAELLRPPTLLRPAMLRALPAPVRAVRAVLAFVATLSARATCSDYEQLLGLTRLQAVCCLCPYGYSCILQVQRSTSISTRMQCLCSHPEISHSQQQDLYAETHDGCKVPACYGVGVQLGCSLIWRLRSACLAGSLQSAAGRRNHYHRWLDHQDHHPVSSLALDLRTQDNLRRCRDTTESQEVRQSARLQTSAMPQIHLHTFLDVLFPDDHAPLTVAGELAALCSLAPCRRTSGGMACCAGVQHVHWVSVV